MGRPETDTTDQPPTRRASQPAILAIGVLFAAGTAALLATAPGTPTQSLAHVATTRAKAAPTTASTVRPEPTTTRPRPVPSTTHPVAPSTTHPRPPSPTTAHHHHTATTAADMGGMDMGGGTVSPPSGNHHPTTTMAMQGTGTVAAGVFCGGWIDHNSIHHTHGYLIFDSTHRMPNATDCANARAFYNRTKAAIAKYADINVALANGFVKGSDPASQVPQHYTNSRPTPGVADPYNPEGLVYRFDAQHHATLLAVFFYERPGTPLVQPGGPLTVWHAHTASGARMLHVWTFGGCRDPFALMYYGCF